MRITLDKNKLLTSIIVFAIVIITANWTLYSSTTPKPTPYNFLNNGISTRAAGLGGATVSFDNDGAGSFVNPALLNIDNNNNLNFTFLKHLLDINSGNLMYVFERTKYGVFAANVVYTNFGSFDYYNEDGQKLPGSFTGNMVSISGSFATEIEERLHGGVSAKLIFNQLEEMSGFAVAIDAGLLYKLDDNRTNFGLSILNAGTELKRFSPSEKADVPLDVRIGFNHRLRGLPLNLNAGFNHLATGDNFGERFAYINIGGELYFGDYVQVRLGFDNYVRKNFAIPQNRGLTGLSAGVGIVTDWFNFDYAISSVASNLYLHRFGVNLKL